MFIDYYSSPFGILEIAADNMHILSVRVIYNKGTEALPNQLTDKAKKLLGEYFLAQNPFIEPSLFLFKGTEFQNAVWIELLKIPYGTTVSYSEIAQRIGKPAAVRAVGTAIGKNPFCILVPCHRVLPVSGKVGNYAYGTPMKKGLLLMERL